MKNYLTALVLTLGLAASADAARHPGNAGSTGIGGAPAETVALRCDIYQHGSPAWRICMGVADASSLICGREPQLSICQRGQQLLSATEQAEVVASASLICGREPQLSICQRGQLLSANDAGMICGREPQLDICKKGQLLSLMGKCPPGTTPGNGCRHLLVSNEKVGPQAAGEKVDNDRRAEPRVRYAGVDQLQLSSLDIFNGR